MRVKRHIRRVGRKRIRVKAHNRKAAKDCPNCDDCDWINPDEIGDYLADMGDSRRDPNG